MNIIKTLFGKIFQLERNKQLDKDQDEIALSPETKFASLNPDERLRVIISLGDTGQNKYFSLLKLSIQSDPDIHVRFAALKRIHLFKEHQELIPFLQSLNPYEKYCNLEPYLSMALSRVRITSKEELQHRINTSTATTKVINIQRWTKFDNGSSIGKIGSESGEILEDFECIDGARVTVEKDGDIAPYSVTLGVYGLMFHTHFSSTNIEAIKIMDFAMIKIDEIFFLYETPENERDAEWNHKHNHLVSELCEEKNGG